MVNVGQDRAGVGEQRRPSVRQFDAARQATEQLDVEFLLQHANLLAERRLLHPQPLGGSRDVPFLSDRDEIPKMTELHSHIQ
jgi:hypothetical protein